MIRVPFPSDVNDSTEIEYARTLDQRPPHLSSDAVVLVSDTPADAAEIAAQKRTDRRFVACLVILALIAAPFIWN